MKRIILFLIAGLFLFSQMVCAGQNTLTLEWEQDISSDFNGWTIKVSDTAGGPYDDGMTYFRDALGNPLAEIYIPYGGTPGATYTGDAVIVSPDGGETTLYFIVTAWDNDNNESTPSNEVYDTFDFLGPNAPYNFKIKVKTRP